MTDQTQTQDQTQDTQQTTDQTQQTQQQTDQQQTQDWTSVFSDEVRTSEAFQQQVGNKYKTADEFFKGHENAMQIVGKKPIVIPGENASESEWNAYYNSLGRPETVQGYKFDVVEGMHPDLKDVDETRQNSFLEAAHKTGLTNKQINDLNKWNGLYESKVHESNLQRIEQVKEQGRSNLKIKWGDQYDVNVALAKKAFNAYGQGLDPNSIDDPTVMEVFHKIGSHTSEDRMQGLQMSNQGQQVDLSVQKQIDNIYADPKHPHNDAEHPSHHEWVGQDGKMAKLFKQLGSTN